MLSRAHRLVRDQDYARVRRYGRNVRMPHALLRWTIVQRRQPRVGIIISKKVEKRATRRNRIRRIMREGLRPLMSGIRPGADIVISITSAADVTVEQARTQLERALTTAQIFRKNLTNAP